jgi:hypothetical protein
MCVRHQDKCENSFDHNYSIQELRPINRHGPMIRCTCMVSSKKIGEPGFLRADGYYLLKR